MSPQTEVIDNAQSQVINSLQEKINSLQNNLEHLQNSKSENSNNTHVMKQNANHRVQNSQNYKQKFRKRFSKLFYSSNNPSNFFGRRNHFQKYKNRTYKNHNGKSKFVSKPYTTKAKNLKYQLCGEEPHIANKCHLFLGNVYSNNYFAITCKTIATCPFQFRTVTLW